MNKVIKNSVCVILAFIIAITSPIFAIKTRAFAITGSIIAGVLGSIALGVAQSIASSEPTVWEDMGNSILNEFQKLPESVQYQANRFNSWIAEQVPVTPQTKQDFRDFYLADFPKERFVVSDDESVNDFFNSIVDQVILSSIDEAATMETESKWQIVDDRYNTPFKDYTNAVDNATSTVLSNVTSKYVNCQSKVTDTGYVREITTSDENVEYKYDFMSSVKILDTIFYENIPRQKTDRVIFVLFYDKNGIITSFERFGHIRYTNNFSIGFKTTSTGYVSQVDILRYKLYTISNTVYWEVDIYNGINGETIENIQKSSYKYENEINNIKFLECNEENAVDIENAIEAGDNNIDTFGVSSTFSPTSISNAGLTDIEKAAVQTGVVSGDLSDEYNPTVTVFPNITTDTDGNIVDDTSITLTDTKTGEVTQVAEKAAEYDKNLKLKLDMPNVFLDKFPFCLPFDLYRLLTCFVYPEKKPVFEVPIKTTITNGGLNYEIDEKIVFDLTVFQVNGIDILKVVLNFGSIAGFTVMLIKITTKFFV